MNERIERYKEIVHRNGEWLAAAERIRPGDFHLFLKEDGSPRSCNFLCPCGCGCECFTPLCTPGAPNSNRTWEYRTAGHLIHPSVLFTAGCKSHFFLNEDGTVHWC